MKERLFEEYPDVVDLKQLCQMLGGVGPKTAYRLLHDGKIRYFRIGKGFKIPKASIVDFIKKD